VVTGLDPSSRVLADAYDDAVRRFIDVPFTEVETRLDDAFTIVPNDWETVAARLGARLMPFSAFSISSSLRHPP
jgi:hypothetical protein